VTIHNKSIEKDQPEPDSYSYRHFL